MERHASIALTNFEDLCDLSERVTEASQFNCSPLR